MARFEEKCVYFEKRINRFTGRPLLKCRVNDRTLCEGGGACALYRKKPLPVKPKPQKKAERPPLMTTKERYKALKERRKRTLSKALRAAMERRGLSYEELAHELAMQEGAVWKWQQGTSLPSDYSLYKLGQYFGMTREELIGGNEDGRDQR